jgi:predicted HTH domain antitoxin
MDRPEHALRISVELPAEAAEIDGRSAGELASELRLLWIIDRVRSSCISLGRGAVLAGMDRWSFMRAMDDRSNLCDRRLRCGPASGSGGVYEREPL